MFVVERPNRLFRLSLKKVTSMEDLVIETASNGFIVYEKPSQPICGKKWAFESAITLADFIREWGEGNTAKEPVSPTGQ